MSIAPQDCRTMEELRAGIDEIDRRIVALLAERVRFIDRAAEIKAAADIPARVPARVEEVVLKVKRAAESSGMDADLAEKIWREMIEWSIAREERVLGPSDDAGA